MRRRVSVGDFSAWWLSRYNKFDEGALMGEMLTFTLCVTFCLSNNLQVEIKTKAAVTPVSATC